MGSFSLISFLIVGIFFIDLCARFAISKSNDISFKAMGLGGLLLLSLGQGQREYLNKSIVVKQFFLSLFFVVFMAGANFCIVLYGLQQQLDFYSFGLILAPVFMLPFYHFLYELIGINPLAISGVIADFRLRGLLSLILVSNIIFPLLEPFNDTVFPVFYFGGHFILAMFALGGFFYLSACLRKAPSVHLSNFSSKSEYLESALLRYLISLLEIIYYVMVIYILFIGETWQAVITSYSHINSMIACAFLVFTTAVIVKMKYYSNAPQSFIFSENKVLFLSFLLFGLNNVFLYYFS